MGPGFALPGFARPGPMLLPPVLSRPSLIPNHAKTRWQIRIDPINSVRAAPVTRGKAQSQLGGCDAAMHTSYPVRGPMSVLLRYSNVERSCKAYRTGTHGAIGSYSRRGPNP